MKTLFTLAALSIFLGSSISSFAQIVYYKDEEGNLHAADSPDLIPEKYRKKLKTLASNPASTAGSNLSKETFKVETSAGRPVILVSVGGREIYMALEPEAETTIIPPSIITALGLKIEGNAQLSASLAQPKGSNVVLTTTVPQIGIKQFQVRNLQVQVTELKNYGKAEGILGSDYFKEFRVSSEMEKSQITIERK